MSITDMLLFQSNIKLISMKIRRQAVEETMECAKQIVQSYGPYSFLQKDRDAICATMDHYKENAYEEG
jgi:hypothetical protein